MALSAHARLLFIGLWNEAFDDGVFEWKPLTLKARLFPVDAVSVDELLAEVEAVDFIRPAYSSDGEKRIGLIRNFQKFQRPKKPNSSGMLPDEWRGYVGLKPDSSEPVPNQFPTSGEKSPQMEDGGGNTVAIATDAEASPASPKERLWVEGKPMLVALGVPPKQSGSIIGRWLRDARDDAGKVLDAISRARDQCPHDPIPWITATLKQDAGNGKSDISTQFRNAFNRIDERIGSLG